MAKLGGLPPAGVIRALKGKVDFYVQNGQVLARKWPRPQKTTVTPKVLPYNRRFSYFMKASHAFHQNVVFCWWAQSLNTHWSWRDVAYRAFTASATGATGPLPPLKKPSMPWPDLRSHFWFCYLSGYHFTPDSITLFFWTDTLFPSVQLITQGGPLYSGEIRKVRRGVDIACGKDWIVSNTAEAHKLTCPSPIYDPVPNPKFPGVNTPWHAASYTVWTPETGLLPPFDQLHLYFTLRYNTPDCSQPGIIWPWSASWWSLFDWTELALRWQNWTDFAGDAPGFAPVLPPDPHYATRRLYDEPYFTESGRKYNPLAYPNARTVVPADYEALRPRRWEPSACGLYDTALPGSPVCLPTNLPAVPCVHSSDVISAIYHGHDEGASLQWASPGTPPVIRGRALYGSVICQSGFLNPPGGCLPALFAALTPGGVSGSCDVPPATFRGWRASVQVEYPQESQYPNPYYDADNNPRVIPTPAEVEAAYPLHPPIVYLQEGVFTKYRRLTGPPWSCPIKVEFFKNQYPLLVNVFIATLGDGPPGLPYPPEYEEIGSGDYPITGGVLSYTYHYPQQLGYWNRGGLGVPYDPAGPIESLLSDPLLLSDGFHYP